MLVGILGVSNGAGHIARYDFDGNLLGTFAAHGSGGFTEATAFIEVPAPAATIPGDFNNDQTVDGDDLAIWKSNFGNNSGSATAAMGDADANGAINGADFLIWQRQIGSVLSPAVWASAAVPEPAAAALGLGALGALVSANRKRRPLSC